MPALLTRTSIHFSLCDHEANASAAYVVCSERYSGVDVLCLPPETTQTQSSTEKSLLSANFALPEAMSTSECFWRNIIARELNATMRRRANMVDVHRREKDNKRALLAPSRHHVLGKAGDQHLIRANRSTFPVHCGFKLI